MKGTANRQDFWERALEWVSHGNVGEYMAAHRTDNNINAVKTYFTAVIDWVSTVFTDVEKEMRGLEWGRLYDAYHQRPYNAKNVSTRVKELYGDPSVKNRKGVFEFILDGETDTRLLDVRLFDDVTKNVAYRKQTASAKEAGVSNCSLCAVKAGPDKTKIWPLKGMEADHVTAWSNGGSTSVENCEMLCVTHNRAKGNR